MNVDATLEQLETLIARARKESFEIDGKEYFVDGDCRLLDPDHLKQPVADRLEVNTLRAIVNYLAAPEHPVKDYWIHVASSTCVQIISRLKGAMNTQRESYVRATHSTGGSLLGEWMLPETMVIALQTRFDATVERDKVQAVVGNIQDNEVRAFADDGVAQQVNVRAGITTVGAVKLPSPITLQPRLTFPEILPMPARLLVLRARKGPGATGGTPILALFDADPDWELRAMAAIEYWLKAELAEADVDCPNFLR